MRAAGVTEPHRCSAHGRTIDEHTDDYAGDCTALPERAGDTLQLVR